MVLNFGALVDKAACFYISWPYWAYCLELKPCYSNIRHENILIIFAAYVYCVFLLSSDSSPNISDHSIQISFITADMAMLFLMTL